jgi:hypothetical protein
MLPQTQAQQRLLAQALRAPRPPQEERQAAKVILQPTAETEPMMPGKPGLYKNIQNKRKRIARQKAAGKTPERMRKPGTKGAPTAAAFRAAAKTARKPKRRTKRG